MGTCKFFEIRRLIKNERLVLLDIKFLGSKQRNPKEKVELKFGFCFVNLVKTDRGREGGGREGDFA